MHIGKEARFGKKEIEPFILWLFNALVIARKDSLIRLIMNVVISFIVNKGTLTRSEYEMFKENGRNIRRPFPIQPSSNKGNYYRWFYNPKTREQRAEGLRVWSETIDNCTKFAVLIEIGCTDTFQVFCNRLREASVPDHQIHTLTSYLKSIGADCVPVGFFEEETKLRLVS